MKNYLFILFSFSCISHCVAQDTRDTVMHRNKLSDSVMEKFFVLRSNPEIREGPYIVLLNRRKLIVRGNYKNGKKIGPWQFFDPAGQLNQKYNYDSKKITFEAPLYSSADFSYLFDDTLKIGDRLTRPLKIGGIFYGFIPYLDLYHLPFETMDINTDLFAANVELLISPLGQLADYNVRITSSQYGYDHVFNLDVKLFSPEDRTFVPATKNGVRVMSRIIIKCFVTSSGGLDFY